MCSGELCICANALQTGYSMKKKQADSKAAATAAEIERSIQALNKMAERLWGDGRETEAKALLDALDALNRALDRIRIGESRKTLH
jgi:molecular chaperone GrpE (heat shock protein)